MQAGEMKKCLHITNGDSAMFVMQKAGIEGVILAWRDVLHDGPVPPMLDLAALSRVRASYISSVGWGDFDVVYKSFRERDKVLQNLDEVEQIALWFEHDLYDQLQILQILDALAGLQSSQLNITLACSDAYLGEMTAAQMREFVPAQQGVTANQSALAQRAWAAFRQPSPIRWAKLRDEDTSVLPFLHDTICRTLEEFPDSQTGVSRTGMQILTIVGAGESRPGYVFGANQKREKRIFMGDSSFWLVIKRLLNKTDPLLALNHGELGGPWDPTQRLALTGLGAEVLAGEKNWLDFTQPDYYIGGTHCCAETRWCFEQMSASVVRLTG